MSYLIPRLRYIKIRSGDPNSIRWPNKVVLHGRLTPEDLFGPPESAEEKANRLPNALIGTPDWSRNRSTIVLGSTRSTIYFSGNNGRIVIVSDDYLPNFQFARNLWNNTSISIERNVLTATFTADSYDEINRLVQAIEFYICSYISLRISASINVEEIFGEMEPDISFGVEVKDVLGRAGTVVSNESRERDIHRALDLFDIPPSCVGRFLIACTYYQQALRLVSPQDTYLPALHVSEVYLNLAKCLGILAGKAQSGGKSQENDRVRELCKKLGYSDAQREGQIIPILLVRNKFDVGHPVGTRIPSEYIAPVHLYGVRAISNVRAFLLRLSNHLRRGEELLDPIESFSEDSADDRLKLSNSLKDYLSQPGLPIE